MNSNRHIDPEDLALFALQFLRPEQNDQVRAHLRDCTICRDELAQIQGELAIVAGTAEMQSPPAMARDRLLQQVAREPRQRPATTNRADSQRVQDSVRPRVDAVPVPTFGSESRSETLREMPRRNIAARTLPWVGWAVAAGLAVVVTQTSRERDGLRSEVASVNHQIASVTAQSSDARRLMETINDPTAQRVTLTLSKQAPVPQGKATYVASKGALVFVANNMEPLEPAKVYELWIIPAGGSAPIAAGTFHPDAGGNANVIMPKLPQGITAKAFGITIEAEGGAQTPTMPIIMAGAAGV